MSRETAVVRENRPAAILTDFANSDYINSNSIPHMGSSDSFGEENDILDSPTFSRQKITEK